MKEYKVDELYSTIFDVSFLIRYGYYDVSMKKTESTIIDNSELEQYYGNPDSFYLKFLNLQKFSKLLENVNLREYFNFNKINKNKETEPILFNIPKNQNTRRLYKMPNLYSYLELCYYTSDNKLVFLEKYRDNVQSTSKFFNQLEFNYEFTKKIEQRLLYGGTNILSVDLSNFYHTLYTHSIPWVIEGKQASKANRHEGFANTVDSILQQCQYGETHGLPTGNLVTRLIAELYMCYIDERMLKKGYKYARYVDDIKFAFSTESQKEAFLTDFSKICRENNLIINDKKLSESPFPFSNNRQKSEIFSYFDGLNKKNKSSSWIKKINDFWDFCMGEEAQGNKGAIKCMFSVVLNNLKSKEMDGVKLTEIFITKEPYTNFNLYERLCSYVNKWHIFF